MVTVSFPFSFINVGLSQCPPPNPSFQTVLLPLNICILDHSPSLALTILHRGSFRCFLLKFPRAECNTDIGCVSQSPFRHECAHSLFFFFFFYYSQGINEDVKQNQTPTLICLPLPPVSLLFSVEQLLFLILQWLFNQFAVWMKASASSPL